MATHAIGIGHALTVEDLPHLVRLVTVHAGGQDIRFLLPQFAADGLAVHGFDLCMTFGTGGRDVAPESEALLAQALSLCQENARLSENGLKAGTVTAAKHAETVAALRKAEMGELQASLEYRLARDELDRIRGVLASSR